MTQVEAIVRVHRELVPSGRALGHIRPAMSINYLCNVATTENSDMMTALHNVDAIVMTQHVLSLHWLKKTTIKSVTDRIIQMPVCGTNRKIIDLTEKKDVAIIKAGPI